MTKQDTEKIFYKNIECSSFDIVLRKKSGEKVKLSSGDAVKSKQSDKGCEYKFSQGITVTAEAELKEDKKSALWKLDVKNESDMAVEYVDYPLVTEIFSGTWEDAADIYRE